MSGVSGAWVSSRPCHGRPRPVRTVPGTGTNSDCLPSRKPAGLCEVGTVNPIAKEGGTWGRSHGRADAGVLLN